MKKQAFIRTAAAVTAILLAGGVFGGCGEKNTDGEKVALITDASGVAGEGVYQEIWNGIQLYTSQRGAEALYYQPETETEKGIELAIRQAADDGVSTIICTGTQACNAVQAMQRQEKEIDFLIMEGEPVNAETGKVEYRGNTSGVFLNTAEAGFLAGYAAVMDGYRSLGFLAGQETSENVAYGSGFIQGANQAAAELELPDGSISVRYLLRGNESISPSSLGEINDWYQNGCEVVYACGPAARLLALEAAETCGGKVIDTDIETDAEEEQILTSAGMDYCQASYQVLLLLAGGEVPGGKTLHLDASCGCLGLQMDEGQFQSFTAEQYQDIVNRIADGTVKVSSENAYESAESMNLTKISL